MRKYSAILGNLGNTCDRFCSRYKDNPSSIEMLKQAGKIDGISGIELVGTWDIRPDNVKKMKSALNDLNFECVSIIPDLFSEAIWRFGSISAKDPSVRQEAMGYLRTMCGIAEEMDCRIVNLWPGQDGFDYLFQGNYLDERNWLVENVAQLAGEFPYLKFALEYKPKEPRTHSYMARMADTLLVCLQTGMDNVGVTIDTGHAFMAGENVSESIVLARQAGDKLFHMHFNDNYKSWDDDMIAGSVHSLEYIEMLYWLDKCAYDGWFSMDQYPYREDATGAIAESINWLKAFDNKMCSSREDIAQTINDGDAVKTSALMRRILFGK
ncbi:sugar phosphate isomerase/epimerase [Ruficoccus amylovorans]|uniref:Sugar phosphate isomerase/epimerase n=1 Tax=Ruficoccus amylovorans TaxID=1804625 RepID=A0A842HFY1_9BACT|nr:sugar phosphate isomerase/epimerase family protein [Ruficoccus amylovorans]MBC2595433.1 sugar phosphate isomerase/epimerase [Ruficoccus amylovorans]